MAIFPARLWIRLVLGAGLTAPMVTHGADLALVQSWLREPMLEPDQTLTEVQDFTEMQVPVLRDYETPGEWEAYASELRKDILNDVVFRGAARSWRQIPTKVEWLETLPGGEGYRIRKLRYEAVPGLWIPALLYEPSALEGRVPAVLNVNGHDGQGKAADYKQIRCINQARRGMLALNTEWLGMGQLSGSNYVHYRMNQLDLCGTSGLAPFYLAMARALDILLDHPNTDPERVAVAGLSGGGWQTIFISSLDERVKLANPVAGYSSFRTRARYTEDLGDSEQTPNDLATLADYTHLTALLAPRPALLTFNAKDNCCFASGHALAPLLEAARPLYQLMGQEGRLRTHINEDPGDHNFGKDNREALYSMFKEFFFGGAADVTTTDLDVSDELKTPEELQVPLPEDNATFHSLAMNLLDKVPLQGKLPIAAGDAERWRNQMRQSLNDVLRTRPYRATAPVVEVHEEGGLKRRRWPLRLRGDWVLPAEEIAPAFPTATVVLIHDEGRASSAEQVRACLERSERVISVDLFYFGECQVTKRDFLYALLLAAIGERPLGLQASQLNAVARWAQREYPGSPIRVEAVGPRSSLIALAAAAAEDRYIGSLSLHGSLGSLKEVVEQNWAVNQRPEWFCFGLLELADIPQLTALVAPRPVVFNGRSERLRTELQDLGRWYELLGSPHRPLP